MLKHLVLMKFNPGTGEAEISDLEKGLASLQGDIPEILGWRFGRDLRPDKVFDFALVSDFVDFEVLGRHRVHPKHVVVLQKVRALCDMIQAVDFEYQP